MDADCPDSKGCMLQELIWPVILGYKEVLRSACTPHSGGICYPRPKCDRQLRYISHYNVDSNRLRQGTRESLGTGQQPVIPACTRRERRKQVGREWWIVLKKTCFCGEVWIDFLSVCPVCSLRCRCRCIAVQTGEQCTWEIQDADGSTHRVANVVDTIPTAVSPTNTSY